MLGSAHDSDVDSVSTASCSDDDEIDDQAIRNMNCEFLQKRKSGMLDQILVQRKQSLANMEFMRKMSMMMMANPGVGAGVGMARQTSDLASFQRGDSSSAKPSPVAAQSSGGVGFNTKGAAAPQTMHKTNSRDRMLRSGVSFTNGPPGAPLGGSSTSPTTSPTAAAASARIPAPPQAAASSNGPASSRANQAGRTAGGGGSSGSEPAAASAASSSSDLRSTVSNVSRLAGGGGGESGTATTTSSRRRTRTVGFGDGDESRDDSSAAAIGSSNPSSPAVVPATGGGGGSLVEFPEHDDGGRGHGESPSVSNSSNASTAPRKPRQNGSKGASTASSAIQRINEEQEEDKEVGSTLVERRESVEPPPLPTPPAKTREEVGDDNNNSAPASGSPSLVDVKAAAAATGGGGGANETSVVSPSNSDRESLPSSDSRGVSWSKFVPPATTEGEGHRHDDDDDDNDTGSGGPTDAAAAPTSTTSATAAATAAATAIAPEDGDVVDEDDNNKTTSIVAAAATGHRDEALAVHLPSLDSLGSLVATQHHHVSPHPPTTTAHVARVPDDPLTHNGGPGTESTTSPPQRTFSRPMSLTHTPVGTLSPKPSERMLRKAHHEDGDDSRREAVAQQHQTSRDGDVGRSESVASKENSATPTEPASFVKVSPLPKIPVESVVNMWSKSALGLGGLLSLQRIHPPPSSLATLSDQAEDSPQASATGKTEEPVPTAATTTELPIASARKPRPADAGVPAVELTPHPPRRARRNPPGRGEKTAAAVAVVPGSEEERAGEHPKQLQGEEGDESNVATTAWSKSTLTHRRGAPDTSGILPTDDGADDNGDGGEAGEDRQVSRETILKKEKLLQDRVKLLKNLVAPSNTVAAVSGSNKKGGAPGKSPRALVPLSLSPGKR